MRDLGKRLARGEASAFAELYDTCADRIHHYLTLRLGNRDAASDVLQEVFLRLVRMRKRLKNVDHHVAYTFTIARNESNRWIRRQKKDSQALELNGSELFAEDTADPIAASERADAVAAALDRLDAADREIVELKTYGELTFREIADVTQLPPGTVATRYRRAVERMHGWLERELR